MPSVFLKKLLVFLITPILSGLIFYLVNLSEIFEIRADTVSITLEVVYIQETHQIDTTQTFSESLVNANNTQLDVSFPADSLTSGEAVEMTFYSTAESMVVSTAPLPSGKMAADTFYNFSFKKVSDNNQVTSFDKAVTLTFYYTDSDISGIDENTLQAYRRSGSEWVVLSDSTVDTGLNKVTASTQQFSNFGIFGDTLPSCGDGSCNGTETCSTCPADCGTCPPAGGGGGGGGGGGYVPPPTATKVIIQGKAYPGASITVLTDGKVATIIKADSLADFKTELTTLTAGTYTFGLWAEDKEGRKSITFSFTVTVTKDMTTSVSGIFIPPTIELEKTNVLRGETLKILGQTAPESEISIYVESPAEIIKKTEAGKEGDWDFLFDTSPLAEGSHTARVKAEDPEGLLSSFSKVLGFFVGKYGVAEVCPRADFNKDGKTNLIDFSILLYWWGKYNPGVDQNQDGIVNLKDFSILMYYWTG